MKNKLDQRRIDRSEQLLEEAFWEFDRRRKSKQVGERFAFKQSIRSRFPQWFDAAERKMSDLVSRVRDNPNYSHWLIMEEAATRIEELEADLEACRAVSAGYCKWNQELKAKNKRLREARRWKNCHTELPTEDGAYWVFNPHAFDGRGWVGHWAWTNGSWGSAPSFDPYRPPDGSVYIKIPEPPNKALKKKA